MLKLRSKIQILGMAVVSVTVVLTVAPVLWWATQDADRWLTQSLLTRGAAFEQLIAARAARLHKDVRLMTANPALTQLPGPDREIDMARELQRQATTGRAAFAVLLDHDGRMLAQSGDVDAGVNAFRTLIKRAAEYGYPRSHLAADGTAYEMLTVPVTDQPGSRWLSVGFRLDDELANLMKLFTGLDATIVLHDGGRSRVIASSLTDPGTRETFLSALNTAERQDSGTLALKLGGAEYRAVTEKLMPNSETVEIVLQESVRQALSSYTRLQEIVLAVAVMALLGALIAANMVANNIGRPIAQLLQAASRVREGNYNEGLRLQRNDELGQLAVAFNAMQEGIADREEQLTWKAQFDDLTGLPNRLLALEMLGDAIARARRDNDPVSLLVVDLNSFSDINSSLGHDIGGALLAQAAERMRAALDSRHTLARLESDEFVVILTDTNVDGALHTAVELQQLLGAGLSVRDVNVGLDTSIGICCFPEHGAQPDKLLLRASVAKNDARNSGEKIHVYQDGREERHVRQLAILGDLRRAIREDELQLFLQPKIRLTDNRVCGAEALVRWDHPGLGFLMPNEFIGIAEKSGNISLITEWALTAAIRECRLWIEEGLDLDVSVNLSGRDLLNPDLPYLISSLLRGRDLGAHHLILEITEQALVRDLKHANRVLGCLRDLGAKIAIDDFGTGYSSLIQVKRLAIDEVKIDRSFVTDLPGDRADVAIVRAAIELAHSLGMEVLAEGVENRATLRWLAAHGCERAQGFHIAKPIPAESFADWVMEYERGLDAQKDSGQSRVDLSFAAGSADRLRPAR